MAGRTLPRWPALGAILFFVLGSLLLQSGAVSSAAVSSSKWGRQVPDLSYERCKTLQSQYQECLTAAWPTPGRAKRDPGSPNSDRRVTYCTLNNLQYVKRCNYCKQDFTFCTPDQYRYSSSLDELVYQVQQAGPLGALQGQAATLAYTLPNRIAQFIGRVTGKTPIITYYYMPPNNGILGSCEQLPDNASPAEMAEINGNGTSGKQCAFMRCEMGDNLAQLGNAIGDLLDLGLSTNTTDAYYYDTITSTLQSIVGIGFKCYSQYRPSEEPSAFDSWHTGGGGGTGFELSCKYPNGTLEQYFNAGGGAGGGFQAYETAYTGGGGGGFGAQGFDLVTGDEIHVGVGSDNQENSNGNSSYGQNIQLDYNNDYAGFGKSVKYMADVQIPACLAAGGTIIGTGGGGAGAGFGGFGVVSPDNDGVGTGFGIQFGINTDINAVDPQTDLVFRMSTGGPGRRLPVVSRVDVKQTKRSLAAKPDIDFTTHSTCRIRPGNTFERVWNGKTYNLPRKQTGKQPYYPSPPPPALPVDDGETTLLRYIETIHDSQAPVKVNTMRVINARNGSTVAEGNFLDGPHNANTSATQAYAAHRLANGSTLYFISARTGVSNTKMPTRPLVTAFRHDNGSNELRFVWTWRGPESHTIQSLTPPVVAPGSVDGQGAVIVGITYGKDQYASTDLSGGFVGLPLTSNEPLWIIDPKAANETAHLAYLTTTNPIPMQGPSASLVAFIVGYTRPPRVPMKDGNDIIGGGPLYLNFSAGAMVKPTMINSGWTQYYDFTTYGNTFYTFALANGALLVANNTGYSINTGVAVWDKPTDDKAHLLTKDGYGVNSPALSLDGRFIFMPWYVNNGPVWLLSFDASNYQLLSNSSVDPGKKFDFGTSLTFIDSVQPDDPACRHVFLVNSIPHQGATGNGFAEIMAYRLTDQGIQEYIYLNRQPLVDFNGYAPPGTSGYVNSNGQLTLFFNQPVKYEGGGVLPGKLEDLDNANYIGFRIT